LAARGARLSAAGGRRGARRPRAGRRGEASLGIDSARCGGGGGGRGWWRRLRPGGCGGCLAAAGSGSGALGARSAGPGLRHAPASRCTATLSRAGSRAERGLRCVRGCPRSPPFRSGTLAVGRGESPFVPPSPGALRRQTCSFLGERPFFPWAMRRAPHLPHTQFWRNLFLHSRKWEPPSSSHCCPRGRLVPLFWSSFPTC
jgi:hypothetical protein